LESPVRFPERIVRGVGWKRRTLFSVPPLPLPTPPFARSMRAFLGGRQKPAGPLLAGDSLPFVQPSPPQQSRQFRFFFRGEAHFPQTSFFLLVLTDPAPPCFSAALSLWALLPGVSPDLPCRFLPVDETLSSCLENIKGLSNSLRFFCSIAVRPLSEGSFCASSSSFLILFFFFSPRRQRSFFFFSGLSPSPK